MQEHPVPQNVTGYEFHLIGQMTLKQFMEVAGGILVAVIINTTNLPQFVKVPLIAIAALTGIALAFIPLEGRPLDRWFFAFIRSIYQPTMFFWKKTNTVPAAFNYTQPAGVDTTPQINYAPIRQSRMQEFVQTKSTSPTTSSLDERDQAAAAILSLFTQTDLPAVTKPVAQPSPVSGEIIVEPIKPIGYEQKVGVTPDLVAPTPQSSETKLAPAGSLHSIESINRPADASELHSAPALTNFPFPNKPTEPNMLAGMVISPDNKIVDNAIITIARVSDNTPVRAIKTNALGQFAIVTPLESGEYSVTVEKDGFVFDKLSVVLDNRVKEPIVIQAK